MRSPEYPSPPLTPPGPRPAPPAPRKVPRRVQLPPCWAKLGVRDRKDELCNVLEHALIESTPRALGRAELKHVWKTLADRAQQQGREPILLYHGSSGRELARFRAWLGYRVHAIGDSFDMRATSAYPIAAAISRLRAAARHPPHMARLRRGRYAVLI